MQAVGLMERPLIFYKNGFGIKIFTKVDMPAMV